VLVFVSPPGGSAFMHELLESVADAVRRGGGAAMTHVGSIHDVDVEDAESLVTVLIPHEYFAIHGDPDPQQLRRTIGFGVEHPGTATFERSAQLMTALGGCVEIGEDAVTVMRRRGVAAHRFRLGCGPQRREMRTAASRDIDVVHLGTADDARLRKLAGLAGQFAGVRTELFLPPHEPMTRDRPDFLTGERKRELLGRSKLLLNIHRESSVAFEWVRALDAISSGCVVLTEPSRGLEPLVPGEHVLVAPAGRLATLARAALTDPDAITAIAAAAYELCTTQLDIVASGRDLVDLAADLLARTPRPGPAAAASTVTRPQPAAPGAAKSPMATWVPCERRLPPRDGAGDPVLADMVRDAARLRLASARPIPDRGPVDAGAVIDVVCVHAAGDGPLGPTVASLRHQRVPLRLHIASSVGRTGDMTTGIAYATSAVHFSERVTRARARNDLLARGSAEFVLVIDSGDEVFMGVLADLLGTLRGQSELQVAYPMAVSGVPLIVNALIPEARRLAEFSYLGRGYLVRRGWLEELDGFDESIEVEEYLDHDFWQRTAAAGAPTRLLRQVGMRLWPQHPPIGLAVLDPGAVRTYLDKRAAQVPAFGSYEDRLHAVGGSPEGSEPRRRAGGVATSTPSG